MPYIKPNDRNKFEAAITQVLPVLIDTVDPVYIRGEYFGYFVNRVCQRFLGVMETNIDSFNSAFFNADKKKTLTNCADKVAAALNRADPLTSAGELNYAISTTLWGFMGAAKGAQPANYGLRAYATGILDKILSTVQTTNTGSQKDMTMAFRRHLIIRGVLSGVLDEFYRCLMVPYERKKIEENGTLWNEGELLLLWPLPEAK